MLFTKVDSWMMGINSNVAGKQKRTFIVYAGGAPKYREKCDEVAAAATPGSRSDRRRAQRPQPQPAEGLQRGGATWHVTAISSSTATCI